MQDIKGKVENIVSKYEQELSQCGIKLRVSKKYCEEPVAEETRNAHEIGIVPLIVNNVTDIIAKKTKKTRAIIT